MSSSEDGALDGDGPSRESGVIFRAPLNLTSGTILESRYRLDEPMASGSSCCIWKAEHLRLAKPVAVKILAVSCPERTQRFVREARMAGSLAHPNVVHIIDYGVFRDAHPFMVMDYVSGLPLNQFLSERELSLTRVCRLMMGVMHGVQAVHEAGIVHRDLKPSNIMVENPDGKAHPWLLDFGISRTDRDLLECADEEDTRLTKSGTILGSPSYMAPEQLRDPKAADLRADIFSLGLILYEALAHEHPYVNDVSTQLKVLTGEGGIPSLETQRSDLPAGLIELVSKAVETNPEHRFASVQEMLDALKLVHRRHRDELQQTPALGSFAPAELIHFDKDD